MKKYVAFVMIPIAGLTYYLMPIRTNSSAPDSSNNASAEKKTGRQSAVVERIRIHTSQSGASSETNNPNGPDSTNPREAQTYLELGIGENFREIYRSDPPQAQSILENRLQEESDLKKQSQLLELLYDVNQTHPALNKLLSAHLSKVLAQGLKNPAEQKKLIRPALVLLFRVSPARSELRAQLDNFLEKTANFEVKKLIIETYSSYYNDSESFRLPETHKGH